MSQWSNGEFGRERRYWSPLKRRFRYTKERVEELHVVTAFDIGFCVDVSWVCVTAPLSSSKRSFIVHMSHCHFDMISKYSWVSNSEKFEWYSMVNFKFMKESIIHQRSCYPRTAGIHDVLIKSCFHVLLKNVKIDRSLGIGNLIWHVVGDDIIMLFYDSCHYNSFFEW